MKQNPKKLASSSKPTRTGESEPSKWGLLLRRWREMKNFTQAQAADVLGVPPTSIAQWEQGRRNLVLSNDAIIAVIRVLGDSGLIPDAVKLPSDVSLDELQANVLQDVRAAVVDAFSKAKSSGTQE